MKLEDVSKEELIKMVRDLRTVMLDIVDNYGFADSISFYMIEDARNVLSKIDIED